MELLGRVSRGVIVPQGDSLLPEGATVRIVYEPTEIEPGEEDRTDGVVVLDEGASLAEFTRVASLPAAAENLRIECVPGQLPVVHGGVPGSVRLTNQRINEILDEEDAEAIKRQWNVPA